MSEDFKLSAIQMEAIKDMGFCDPLHDACDQNDDGMIYLDDQRSSFILLDGYQEAFKKLASLGGVSNAIDAVDLVKLTDLEELAELMAKDPAYEVVKKRHTGLEFNKKELKPMLELLKPGIPKRHFKRMIYYAQTALKQIADKTLVPDGDYGEHTRQVISKFQKAVKISPDDGTLLGPQTLGTIIMRCRYSKSKLLKTLRDEVDIASPDGFLINDALTVTEIEIREDVIVALKWLGYIGESVESKDNELIKNALMNNFDGATLVGPIVLGRIIDRIEEDRVGQDII